MKRVFCGIIVFMMIILSVNAAADSGVTIYVNGNLLQCDAQPFIKNGRTMVPMRAIFEGLGADVTWDEETNTAVAVREYTDVAVTIGSPYMIIQGYRAVPLDSPAVLIEDRTMVPVRAISEAFECEVYWEEDTRSVKIYTPDFIDFSEAEDTQTVVEVATVTELLNSVGSNRKLVLTSDYYNFSQVGEVNNEHIEKQLYRDDEYMDGYIIKGVVNLTIEGNAEIATDDIYADVLSFERCGNITLKGLTVGHTEYFDEYQCEGMVTAFKNCETVNIENCKLYGCGAVGVFADNVNGLNLSNSKIYDCSYSAVWLSDSTEINISECEMFDGTYWGGVCRIDNSDVEFEKCKVYNNKMSDNSWNAFIETENDLRPSQINWNNCEFTDNTFKTIASYGTKNMVFNNCTFKNNTGDMDCDGVTYNN